MKNKKKNHEVTQLQGIIQSLTIINKKLYGSFVVEECLYSLNLNFHEYSSFIVYGVLIDE